MRDLHRQAHRISRSRLLRHRRRLPEDGFIAEEDSSSLLDDAELLAQVASEAINLGKSYETGGKQRLDHIDGTRGFLP